MAKRTNKTSHVLNLLTNRIGLSPEELELRALPEKTPEPASERAPAGGPVIHVEKPVRKVTLSVSEQIRANLEKVEKKESAAMSMEILNKNVIPAAPQSAPHVTRIEAFAPENFDEQNENPTGGEEPAPAVQATQEAEPATAEPVAEKPAPAIQAAPEPVRAREEIPEAVEAVKERTVDNIGKSMDGLIMTNILEEVMRLDAPVIMEQLEMCSCDRCVADALALALNSMQPKYVVSKKGALFAKIASYGNQYKTDIIAHLTHACVIVKQSPSHK